MDTLLSDTLQFFVSMLDIGDFDELLLLSEGSSGETKKGNEDTSPNVLILEWIRGLCATFVALLHDNKTSLDLLECTL